MILITGGAGFIGSLLAHELNAQGREDLIIVDRLESDEKWKNLQGLSFDRFIHADDLFCPEYENYLSTLTTIFHMGACSSTTERDVDFLMKNNLEYSQELFEIATERQIPIIYASSAATYGDGEQGYSDEHSKVSELRPLNAYGFSKQLMDQWVLRQKKTPPLWFGIKFFNVYGPKEDHKGDMRSLVNKAYSQILETGKVKLFKSYKEGFKDGWQLRDFVYGRDVAKAMIELSKLKEGSCILNMGTGKARGFYELVEATFKAMGKETNVEYIEMPESIRDQYQYYTQAEMQKFSKLCPHFQWSSVEDGVKDYVQNFLMK